MGNSDGALWGASPGALQQEAVVLTSNPGSGFHCAVLESVRFTCLMGVAKLQQTGRSKIGGERPWEAEACVLVKNRRCLPLDDPRGHTSSQALG